jgi:hypothetical protein
MNFDGWTSPSLRCAQCGCWRRGEALREHAISGKGAAWTVTPPPPRVTAQVSSSAPWVLEAKRRNEAAGASGMYKAAGPRVINTQQQHQQPRAR